MAGSDEAPEATEWRRTAKFYRRSLGLPWLIGLVVIPLLLGVIGYGELDRSRSEANGPTGVVPTLNAPKPPGGAPATPTVPGLSLAPVSITRSGNDITLRGEFPSAAAKASLVDAVLAGYGHSVNVVDYLGINPNVISLDFSNAEPVFKAAASVPDFSLAVEGDTVTLSGTSGSGNQEEAVEQAANAAWRNLNIVDTMGINGPVMPTGPASPAPAPGGAGPAPAPGGAGNACANLQSDIKALSPITFATDGSILTPANVQTLGQVADKLKACPGATVTVNGYTDNTGNDAINIPLSADRADAVVDFLIARGVTHDHLTAKGHGSADPVADNGNPGGQAKNRRVEIVVS